MTHLTKLNARVVSITPSQKEVVFYYHHPNFSATPLFS